MNACSCLDGEVRYTQFESAELGTDDLYADISLLTCKDCGRRWLRYYLVFEAYSKSGRWYRGELAPDAAVDPGTAAKLFESMKGYWQGGSRFDGKVSWQTGPIYTGP